MTRGKGFYVSAKNNPQVASYIAALKTGEKSQYVSHRNDGSRVVKRSSAKRPSRVFDTQKDALKYAKGVAKKNNASVFVYSKDGDIRRG